MTVTLYPYQEVCVAMALKAGYSINACEPGLGKTRVALEVIRRTGQDGLIVGPAFLRGSWMNEAKKVGVTNIHYVNYSMIHKESQKSLEKYKVWIADEAHYLKSVKAIRTNAYYTLLKKCKPSYWVALTGTPIRSRVSDLWVLLAICSQPGRGLNGKILEGDLQNYYKFCRHFCNVEILRIRGARVEKFSGVKEKNLPELKALLADKYIRYRVDQVLTSLPTMTTIEVPLQLKPVPGLEEAFNNYMSGGKVDSTAKATSALLKAKATAEYVKDLMESGESVLVFSDHVAPVHEIAKHLESVAVITGATPADHRHNFVEMFQRGEIKAIVATIGALSTGVTLTAARHVFFNDLSWSPSEVVQASKRIHRIGQKDACFRHIMIGSETDAYIAKTLVEKENTILRVLN